MLSAADSVTIHELHAVEQLREIEHLQREVWRIQDLEIVPSGEMIAVVHAGGLALGAFDNGRMVGFSYGFPGYEHGEVSLHSHMTGVLPSHRDTGVGHQLKQMQKTRALARGIHRVTWTFDPLQSRNAHFNFTKLGVICDRYFVNFYGEDAVLFLEGAGTDRFWVTWRLDGPRDVLPEKFEVTPLVALADGNEPARDERGFGGRYALVEIPPDINGLQSQDATLVKRWREATRWAFTKAIDQGYVIVGYQGPKQRGHQAGAYVLQAIHAR